MAKRYFTIINLLLISAGVYLSVNAIYTLATAWFDQNTIRRAVPRQDSFSETEPQPPLSRYRAITERNLFNTKKVALPIPKTVNIENLKQTNLKLRLWGTVTGQDRRAYAVIEDTKTRKQNLYRTGDTIQNATVKLILREKVVLNVNDRDEILGIEETGAGKGRAKIAQRNTTTPRIPVSSYPRKFKLKSEQIQSALENIGQIMDQARIRPHIENGAPAGISITGIKPKAIFRKMRLRNGDIITGVNGNPIESVEDAIKIFEDISSATEVQLEIKRRGRKQTLNYEIE